MAKRKVSEINASSMADISFLLLIFFLVATSMETTTGLARRLPEPLPPDFKPEEIDIKQRDIFVVRINSLNQLMVQGELMDITQLKNKAKEFIKNEREDIHLPELFTEDFPDLGPIAYTKNHVISVMNDVDTQYKVYIDVQNELVAAYNELRNELAMNKYGKSFSELDENLQKSIQKVYPQKISEAEPKNYGGNK
jgi:biopolymer transport protein ExbD